MARGYRQAKRSGTADETRQRIVQATSDLHAEQGIAATSMKQIAARAGVSVGSVYHHFPTYDQAITACGAYALSRFPMPTSAIFEGAASRAERVRRLTRAMFETFAGVRAFGSVIADCEKLPVLQPFVAQEQSTRLTLTAEAVGAAGAAGEVARTLAGLLDSGAWDAFARLGFGPEAAADRVAEVANAWLETLQPEETP